MRVLPALALVSTLLLGACQNPDGSMNVPGTLAIGAGVGLVALALASSNDRPRHHGGYRQQGYGHQGYGHQGYAQGYGRRGW